MLRIAVIFYLAIVLAGWVVELLFAPVGLIPDERNAEVVRATVAWDYTTWLNIGAFALTAALGVRFVTAGGVAMLRHMNDMPEDHSPGHPASST